MKNFLAFLGGKVDVYEFTPPEWLARILLAYLTLFALIEWDDQEEGWYIPNTALNKAKLMLAGLMPLGLVFSVLQSMY
jgi:hypothetical protein